MRTLSITLALLCSSACYAADYGSEYTKQYMHQQNSIAQSYQQQMVNNSRGIGVQTNDNPAKQMQSNMQMQGMRSQQDMAQAYNRAMQAH